ncbi:tape measure protein [Rathayibacter sp. VKM Ac-2630]|uniref:tape measure protein n=1 Tax=Rathayibacter sp. VKM Ac-2630 TaxID=1938617 RepID=UPI0009CE8F0D|nr:tape measure protein [Rathayibacter sp. VKM Ac-2630]OOB90749.1 hypothetical protein B0T42_10100 [Rathayibacter sp. VKM Ac-2630]
MSSEVGSGHISIFPVMTGFKSRVRKETQDAATSSARAFTGGFKGAGSTTGRRLGTDLKSALDRSAGDLGAQSMKDLTSQAASAANALSKARLKQQDDAGKVRIAEARLAEAVEKSGAASSQAVAAEERLAAARRAHASTTDTVTAASGRLKTAQDAVRRATQDAATGSESAGGKLRGFVSAAGGGLSGLARTASSVGSRIASGLGNGFRAAQTTAGVALGAMAAKIGSLVPEALTASDATDKFKSTLSFADLDSSRIAELTASTQAYADRTVYSLSDIQAVTAQLAANGVKDYDRLAEAGGNLNAVAGGNAETYKSVGMALTQTAGQGKLTTENWNQLADAIPGASGKLQEALLSAGAYTGNFREAMEKGEISAEEFNAAILDLGMTDAAKEAATSTATFEGAFGSLNAAIVGGLVKTIAPLKPFITGALTGAGTAVTGFFTRVATGVEGLVALVSRGDFTSAFRTAFGVQEDSPVVDFLLSARDAVIGFTSTLPDLSALMGPVVAILGVGGLAGILTRITPLMTLLPGLGGALGVLAGPLGIVAAGLAGFALSGGDASALASGLTGVISSVLAAIPGLVQQVATFVPQIVSAILAQVPALLTAGVSIVTALVQGLVTAIPAIALGAVTLVTGLLTAIVANLPLIIAAAIQLVTALLQGIVTALPVLIQGALTLVTGLLTGILAALPLIIESGIGLVFALVQGIISALPTILSSALTLVLGLLLAIVQSLPMIIEAGIQLVLSLVTGLIATLPSLITAAIELVLQLVAGLLTMLPQLIVAGIELVLALIVGLVTAIPQIIKMLPQIVMAIWDGLANVDWADLGLQIVRGLIDGLVAAGGELFSAVTDLASQAFGGFTDFFDINSPSRLMRGAGRNVVRGAVEGTKDESEAYGDSLVRMARSAAGRAEGAMTVAAGTVEVSASADVAGTPAGGRTGRRDFPEELHIHAQPGMSEAALVKAAMAELDFQARRSDG